MNFRALQYFVKLAELKHFSKAAEACFVSQPTLSTQIRKFEESIDEIREMLRSVLGIQIPKVFSLYQN